MLVASGLFMIVCWKHTVIVLFSYSIDMKIFLNHIWLIGWGYRKWREDVMDKSYIP